MYQLWERLWLIHLLLLFSDWWFWFLFEPWRQFSWSFLVELSFLGNSRKIRKIYKISLNLVKFFNWLLTSFWSASVIIILIVSIHISHLTPILVSLVVFWLVLMPVILTIIFSFTTFRKARCSLVSCLILLKSVFK